MEPMRIRLFGRTLFIGLLAKREPVPVREKKKAKGNASEDWWRCFCDCGSIVSTCACGRVLFANSEDAGDWEDGELEGLRQKWEEKPDAVIGMNDSDTVSVSRLGLIWGCPCGESIKHENYLIDNQTSILNYYRLRAQQHEIRGRPDRGTSKDGRGRRIRIGKERDNNAGSESINGQAGTSANASA
jgi:hypothetical protein